MSEASSKSPNLDRVSKEFINNLEASGGKPLYEMTVDDARQFLVDLQKKTYKEIPAEIADIDIFTEAAGTVSVRLVRPHDSNETLPVILYLHGGGWILGDKETHDMLIRKLANCTNSVVVFVNYSRSPEAVYPMALNQAYGVLEYLYNNPEEFNIDPDRIVIAGDSAGGNLATSVALKSLRSGGPRILFQALLYPVTDANMDSDSYKLFKDGPWLTKKSMEWFWNAYLPDKRLKNDIYVSPLRACIDDLAGMPSALIITAENDVLRDEGEAYARKLDSAGVDVLNVRMNGTIHDFLMLNALSETPQAKGALMLACNMLKKALEK